jgi:hypothetical protein
MSLTPAFDPLRQVTLFYESAETHDDDERAMRFDSYLRGKLEDKVKLGLIKPEERKQMLETMSNLQIQEFLSRLDDDN